MAIKLLSAQGAMVTGNSPGTPHLLTAVPSYVTSQGSHPSSPLPHSPINNSSGVHGAVYMAQSLAVSSSPAPTTYFIAPSAGFVTLATEPAASSGGGTAPSSNSPWAQLPMSRLNLDGRRGSYPDPTSLLSVSQYSFSMELFSRALAEPWLGHNDPLSKQVK